jgi:chorismate mutase
MNTTVVRQETATTSLLLPHVQEILRSAEQELSGLLRQRGEIMKRIGTIKQMLGGLAELFGDSILDQELQTLLDRGISNRHKGFTRACRQILMESRTPLRARHGCEQLWRRFPDLARRHKDLGASVTTVFHRLVEYGEARCCLDEQGVRVWEWLAEPQPLANRASLTGRELLAETAHQPVGTT